MKLTSIIGLGAPAVLLLGLALRPAHAEDSFRYVSPQPGAKLVPGGTTIILRPAVRPARGLAALGSTEVVGTISGSHDGEWILADHGRVFIFRPSEPFSPGETVAVNVTVDDPESDELSYRFTIAPEVDEAARSLIDSGFVIGECRDDHRPAGTPPSRAAAPQNNAMVLPAGFPGITVTVNDNPAPGYLFVAPRLPSNAPPRYAMMLDDSGTPAFFRLLASQPADFKQQRVGGLYSYMDSYVQAYRVVNESFELQDTFGPENGYPWVDGHDCQVLPNGNVLVGIIDLQTVDMSVIVPGGHPAATVHGFVLQEQDPSHNVVFQWRSWDHIPITDAVGVNLTARFIDAVHFNAFEPDTDGNIMISFRELNEITKIDRQTGNILWRLGGGHSDFTLVGDTRWFERQHSVRRTDTGTVTIFDNGAFTPPFESRAVEYDLDEVNKVATLVWEFKDSPPRYAPYGGNVQRLSNGNTVINWCPVGVVTEVRNDGTKAFEMALDQEWTYRAFRFEWNGIAARPELWHFATPFQATLHFAKFGDPDVAQFHVYRGPLPGPTTRVGSTTADSYVLDVTPSEILHVRVTAEDSGGVESAFSNEVTIQVPSAVGAPEVAGAAAGLVLRPNRPNPFGALTSIGFSLPRPGVMDLSIYDVSGRLVRTLAGGVVDDGASVVTWDGRDERGRPAASGVYFCRLRAGGQEVARRMTLRR